MLGLLQPAGRLQLQAQVVPQLHVVWVDLNTRYEQVQVCVPVLWSEDSATTQSGIDTSIHTTCLSVIKVKHILI